MKCPKHCYLHSSMQQTTLARTCTQTWGLGNCFSIIHVIKLKSLQSSNYPPWLRRLFKEGPCCEEETLLSTTSHYCHCHPLRAVPSLHTRVKGWATFDPENVCLQWVIGDDLELALDHFHWWRWLLSHPWNVKSLISPPFFKVFFVQALVIPEIYVQGLQVGLQIPHP